MFKCFDQKSAYVDLVGAFVSSESAKESRPMNLQNENKDSMSKERLISNRLGLKAYLNGKNKKISDLKVFVSPMKKKISGKTANLHVDEMNSESEESRLEVAMSSEEDGSIPLPESQSSNGKQKADLMNLEYSGDNSCEYDGDISKELFSDGEFNLCHEITTIGLNILVLEILFVLNCKQFR